MSREGRIIGIIVMVAAALACGGRESAPSNSIEPSELAARVSSNTAPVILDVRTPEEFASGHIPGAINIPEEEVADRIASLSLSSNAEIVVHCQRGGRAASAEATLRELGYRNVRDLVGHMEAWRDGGHPLE